MKLNYNQKYVSIGIFLIFGFIHIKGADTSSSVSNITNARDLIEVHFPDRMLKLNKQVLLQMPYFQAMLAPENIGKVYYNLNYDYKTVSDQYSMAALPRRKLLNNIIALAQSKDKIDLKLSPEQIPYFIFLYSLLFKMINNQITSFDDIITVIKNSRLSNPDNIQELLNIAYNFFSQDAIHKAFDTMEIELLKDSLKPDASGDISAVFFSPADEMEQVILNLIKAENKRIHLACYLFNNPLIAKELAKAQQRGVHIEIILDQRSQKGLTQLYNVGLPQCAWPKAKPEPLPLMHNKFFIFYHNIYDQQILVTGSANCTTSSQQNNEENIIVTNDIGLIEQFDQRFKHLHNSAQCYPGKKLLRKIQNDNLNVIELFKYSNMILQGLEYLHTTYK
jgi:phosphatidylserine/phosphatidylglycerophosphate/cardiolipin synthase-like enzyme